LVRTASLRQDLVDAIGVIAKHDRPGLAADARSWVGGDPAKMREVQVSLGMRASDPSLDAGVRDAYGALRIASNGPSGLHAAFMDFLDREGPAPAARASGASSATTGAAAKPRKDLVTAIDQLSAHHDHFAVMKDAGDWVSGNPRKMNAVKASLDMRHSDASLDPGVRDAYRVLWVASNVGDGALHAAYQDFLERDARGATPPPPRGFPKP
jgi:hypothetical protein